MAEATSSLWQRLYRRVQSTLYAEQVFCSITSEMNYLPNFARQPVLRSLHAENYESSYHLNTAAGNLVRILAGAHSQRQQQRLVLMTVECFIEAREHMDKAAGYLRQLETTDKRDKAWIYAAWHWHEQRVHWLTKAMRRLQASVPESVWQAGVGLVKS
ncbi:hypothetical protein [Alicyclobacillus kakegawensis]|uniref:hypothetical protein n=1 Tax=Alicyclobacillus kakegawensis TaxID=392012 RepID=UPI000829A500|nr:hypothetical protein [Alicyclobacillus kakegawensis]